MPVVLGIILGFAVFAYLGMIIGPIIALLNFIVGRFFIASVILTISIFCGTCIHSDVIVEPEIYKFLLGFGLLLEGMKWFTIAWWKSWHPVKGPEPGLEIPAQGEFTTRTNRAANFDMTVSEAAMVAAWAASQGMDININVVDEDKPVMRDVTPAKKLLGRGGAASAE